MPKNEIMQRRVTVMLSVQGLQSQKMCSRAPRRGGTFPIPDDSDIIVVSRVNGELRYSVSCSNHVVMCHGSHDLKVTVSDCALWVGESDGGILCPLFVWVTPQVGVIVGPLWHGSGSGNEVGATHSQS